MGKVKGTPRMVTRAQVPTASVTKTPDSGLSS